VDVTTYQVLHHVDSRVVIEMEAAHLYAVPTAVSGEHGMLDYAETLMRCKSTVYQIAHRCGPSNHLVRKDGHEEPPPPPESVAFEESRAKARLRNTPKKRVPRAGEGKKAGVSKNTTTGSRPTTWTTEPCSASRLTVPTVRFLWLTKWSTRRSASARRTLIHLARRR
jgi:hypothetical protein